MSQSEVKPTVLRAPASGAQRAPRELFAAVDLGSNSFHLILTRLRHGELQVIDKDREAVRIAAGLGADRRLSKGAQERALACMHRFSERVRNLPTDHVRAVGTNTFRRAVNGRRFLDDAARVLGHPVEIISGQEEARLVYLGVAHSTPRQAGPRVVIDIGGGSTECILGNGSDVCAATSLPMGCVSYSQRFFRGGRVNESAFQQAVISASLELTSFEPSLQHAGALTFLGSSGTAHAIQRILLASGWSDGGITLDGLRRLRRALFEAGRVRRLQLPQLSRDRRQVLPGGLAILYAAFKTLGFEHMLAVPGGLREGLLFDLLGRWRLEDVRDRTIRALVGRYNLDDAQGERVERTVQTFLAQTEPNWELGRHRQLLCWAARVHELGLAISRAGHHKHAEYLVMHSELQGFSRDDQQVLGALIRSHRKRIPPGRLDDLPLLKGKTARRLCVLLRLAVLLHRTRGARPLPEVRITARKSRIRLTFPPDWLPEHPLTHADLQKEASYLAAEGFDLSFF